MEPDARAVEELIRRLLTRRSGRPSASRRSSRGGCSRGSPRAGASTPSRSSSRTSATGSPAASPAPRFPSRASARGRKAPRARATASLLRARSRPRARRADPSSAATALAHRSTARKRKEGGAGGRRPRRPAKRTPTARRRAGSPGRGSSGESSRSIPSSVPERHGSVHRRHDRRSHGHRPDPCTGPAGDGRRFLRRGGGGSRFEAAGPRSPPQGAGAPRPRRWRGCHGWEGAALSGTTQPEDREPAVARDEADSEHAGAVVA